jgi:hypothetical protein
VSHRSQPPVITMSPLSTEAIKGSLSGQPSSGRRRKISQAMPASYWLKRKNGGEISPEAISHDKRRYPPGWQETSLAYSPLTLARRVSLREIHDARGLDVVRGVDPRRILRRCVPPGVPRASQSRVPVSVISAHSETETRRILGPSADTCGVRAWKARVPARHESLKHHTVCAGGHEKGFQQGKLPRRRREVKHGRILHPSARFDRVASFVILFWPSAEVTSAQGSPRTTSDKCTWITGRQRVSNT